MIAEYPATIGRAPAHERAPLQPDLLGIAAAPVYPEARYCLVGMVHKIAEVRLSPDGRHAHLIVTIHQPDHGGHSRMPIVAVYSAHEREVLALQALATRLAVGTLALVICRGIDVDTQRHELRAWRCDRITCIDAAEAAQFIPDHQLAQDEHPTGGTDD